MCEGHLKEITLKLLSYASDWCVSTVPSRAQPGKDESAAPEGWQCKAIPFKVWQVAKIVGRIINPSVGGSGHKRMDWQSVLHLSMVSHPQTTAVNQLLYEPFSWSEIFVFFVNE